jgi:hypothetical protein
MNQFLLPLLVLFFISSPTSWGSQGRYALVIGNAAYPHATLNNPANDATDMAAKLIQRGFMVTQLLNANKRQMEESINTFTDTLRGTDAVGLFYYAGHGVELDGENYLVPVDAVLKDEIDARYSTVNVGQLLDRMRQAGNSLNLVILDACRNNPFTRSWRGFNRAGLAQMQPAAGTLVLYASEPRKEAQDGNGRNGIFTKYLLAAMDVQGVQVEDAFKQLSELVTKETGGQQTPWSEGVIHGRFFFWPGVPSTPVSEGGDAEERLWLDMHRCGTAACLRAYQKAYPLGRFNDIATALLEYLSPQPTIQASPEPSLQPPTNWYSVWPISPRIWLVFIISVLFMLGTFYSFRFISGNYLRSGNVLKNINIAHFCQDKFSYDLNYL